MRVYSTDQLELLHELRRGVVSAEILCVAFSPGPYLAVASNKGTVHAYRLTGEGQARRWSLFSGGLRAWSFAQYRGSAERYCCAFVGETEVVVLGSDGSCAKVHFDPERGGTMTKEAWFLLDEL